MSSAANCAFIIIYSKLELCISSKVGHKNWKNNQYKIGKTINTKVEYFRSWL